MTTFWEIVRIFAAFVGLAMMVASLWMFYADDPREHEFFVEGALILILTRQRGAEVKEG